jgi:hypothetical protein
MISEYPPQPTTFPRANWSARLVRWELETGECSDPDNDETRLVGGLL